MGVPGYSSILEITLYPAFRNEFNQMSDISCYPWGNVRIQNSYSRVQRPDFSS